MTLEKVEQAVLQIFKNQAPKDKGVLEGQIRIERTDYGFNIVSDIYYMEYTTEKWGYNKQWKKTLINPNERWWQQAFEIAIKFLATVYGKGFIREQ